MTIKEYQDCSPSTKVSNCFVVNLDGKAISNKSDLFNELKKEYSLPDTNGWDSISDWMTDLSWIETSNFQMNIHNFSKFLANDIESKKIFLEVLSEDILPFWEKEVLTTVIGGETKGFTVYCIN